jgi:hypothetical protein
MASVVVNGDTSGAVTLSAPAVAGTVTVTLPSTSGTMLTTASTGVVTQAMLSTNVAGNGPAFSAYASAAQSFANGVLTKIAFDTETVDTASCYNTSTYRFTPNVAGYYLIKGGIGFNLASGICNVWLYRTGVQTVIGSQIVNNSSVVVALLNEIVYLNGSTDYVELYGSQNGGSTSNNYALGSFVTFQGAMIRAA